MSHESNCFARAAKACGGSLAVRPLITGADWHEKAPIVGHAASYTEALALVRKAGYRVMTVGGVHEVNVYDEDDFESEFIITVHP